MVHNSRQSTLIESHHYQLKQSRILLGYLLSLCLIIIFLVVTYFNGWLQIALILLISIYLYVEINRYKLSANEDSTTVSLNSITNEIQIKQKKIDKNFDNFKLYSNRWFLILHLRQANNCCHLILLGDRFSSVTEYLSFRHQIKRMDSNSKC